MRQKEDVEARLSRPQPLKTFRKHNFAEVAVYAAIVGTLLGWRLMRWLRTRRVVSLKTPAYP